MDANQRHQNARKKTPDGRSGKQAPTSAAEPPTTQWHPSEAELDRLVESGRRAQGLAPRLVDADSCREIARYWMTAG